MKKINSMIACGILAVSLAAASMTGCGKELDGTQIVATVNGQDVTLGMASYMVRDQQAQMENMYQMLSASYGMAVPENIWSEPGEDGKTAGQTAKDETMNNIKEMIVIKDHAADYNITLTEEETAKIQQAAKAFMEANSEETLKKLAVSQSDIEQILELSTYQYKMREPMVADVDREVSDEEANQSKITYVRVSTMGTEQDEDGNIIELTEDEKAAKKEMAEAVLEKVKAAEPGTAMDGLAKEIDESLMASSGNFTTAGSAEDTIDPAVIEAAKGLADGEVAAEVVSGSDGYYVVRMELTLDQEATDNKRESIINTRESEAYDALVAEWAEAAESTVNEDVWKKVEVTDAVSFQYKPAEQPAADPAEGTTEPEAEAEAAEEPAE